MLNDEFEKIKQYLINNNMAIGINISKETNLRNELGIDSLKLVQVIVDMEDMFNVCIDESKLEPEKLITVNDLTIIINQTLSNVVNKEK